MIQRIQSIYLLLAAAALVGFVLLSNMWSLLVVTLGAWSEVAIMALAALGGLAALIAIFLYKERTKQKRIATVAQWIDLALIVLIVVGFGLFSFGEDNGLVAGLPEYGVTLLPIVAYIFLRLALRGINRDIEKVRSMDRLR